MAGIGVGELVIVLIIVLLLFGARKLPELASSLGQSLKEFRRATEVEDEEGTSQATEETGSSGGGTRSPS